MLSSRTPYSEGRLRPKGGFFSANNLEVKRVSEG